MCVSNALYVRWVQIAYETRINVFRNSWIFISSPQTRFNDKISVSSFSQSNRFYNAVMRKPIKIELTLIIVYIVIQGLTLLWIFLIRLVLHISIPFSFEVLKPSLNQISHSIHWSLSWADYHDFSAEKWMELLKAKKWIYNSKITSIFIRYRAIISLFKCPM